MDTKKKNSMINIQGLKENNDPYYRYKMEEVVIKSQKNKIVFENIDVIAKSLDRDIQFLLKFLKTFFGTSIEYKNGIASTTKEIMQDDMQSAIYKFIDEFVLCKQCSNPETMMEIKKKKTFMQCKACSYKSEI